MAYLKILLDENDCGFVESALTFWEKECRQQQAPIQAGCVRETFRRFVEQHAEQARKK